MQYEIMVLGVVTSTLFYELTGISPGGIVVPSYIALYFNDPSKILYTIFLAIISALTVKFLSNYMILYGRRKFAMCIVISFLLGVLIKYINLEIFVKYNFYFFDKRAIGIIIAGILASDIEKNGIIKTVTSLLIVSISINSLYEIFGRLVK